MVELEHTQFVHSLPSMPPINTNCKWISQHCIHGSTHSHTHHKKQKQNLHSSSLVGMVVLCTQRRLGSLPHSLTHPLIAQSAEALSTECIRTFQEREREPNYELQFIKFTWRVMLSLVVWLPNNCTHNQFDCGGNSAFNSTATTKLTHKILSSTYGVSILKWLKKKIMN